MNKEEIHRIRPAGRHLLTIGRDLIQDSYAAVVELVKNAYDADSPDVHILFKADTKKQAYTLTISDHGHGMSKDTVINAWLVPSTKDKLERKVSPSGRVMQGRKGVGRYAASILGSDLLLETVTASGEKTTILIGWDAFEAEEYLENVEILVDSDTVSGDYTGTTLTIHGDIKHFLEWDQKQFDKLRFELKKLISPVDQDQKEDNDFEIYLVISGFPGVQNVDEVMEPYPIFDLFDYRITGVINENGKGELIYSQQKARNSPLQKINFDFGSPTGCGRLVFDIRVYDREKEAIESLITRGLKDEYGSYVTRNEARNLLNQYNGIGVYRNGFRIRPLGDPDFDWLKLNEQRVQQPSLRIGSNQVIGYVQIQSEEQSDLIEKSARDGLKENNAFDNLKAISKDVVALLEARRFSYRRKAGLSKSALKIEKELEKLFSFENLKQEVKKSFTAAGMSLKATNAVISLIEKEEEAKNETAEQIRQAVAIYQGQATLGKIITVILHESRNAINIFRNSIPRIKRFRENWETKKNENDLEEISQIGADLEINSDILVSLFKKIDPLAAGRRPKKTPLNLKKQIQGCFNVFSEQIKEHNISVYLNMENELMFEGWQADVYAIFINLIENSIFWMTEKQSENKSIIISVKIENNKLLHIDYRDTGPGIEPQHIKDEVIFEPQFSTKVGGTGLGLAIAGEAAHRNGLTLKALESDNGAYFRLQVISEDEI